MAASFWNSASMSLTTVDKKEKKIRFTSVRDWISNRKVDKNSSFLAFMTLHAKDMLKNCRNITKKTSKMLSRQWNITLSMFNSTDPTVLYVLFGMRFLVDESSHLIKHDPSRLLWVIFINYILEFWAAASRHSTNVFHRREIASPLRDLCKFHENAWKLIMLHIELENIMERRIWILYNPHFVNNPDFLARISSIFMTPS